MLSSPERSPSFLRRVPPHPWTQGEDQSEGYLGDDSERDNTETVRRSRKRSVSKSPTEQQPASVPPVASSSNTAYTGPVTPPRPSSYGLDEDFKRVERIRTERSETPYMVQLRDARRMMEVNQGSSTAGSFVAQARTDDEGRIGRPPVVRSLPLVVGEDDAGYWSRITMARLGVRGVGNQDPAVQGGSAPMFLNGWLPRTMVGVNGGGMGNFGLGNGQDYAGPQLSRTQGGDEEDLD